MGRGRSLVGPSKLACFAAAGPADAVGPGRTGRGGVSECVVIVSWLPEVPVGAMFRRAEGVE